MLFLPRLHLPLMNNSPAPATTPVRHKSPPPPAATAATVEMKRPLFTTKVASVVLNRAAQKVKLLNVALVSPSRAAHGADCLAPCCGLAPLPVERKRQVDTHYGWR